jgi:hypothetical protein
MKTRVTEYGLFIPKEMLEGMEEVEINKVNGTLIVAPVVPETPTEGYDPIFDLGKYPVEVDVNDASTHHDRYLTSP